MDIFLDTADLNVIKRWMPTGVVKGITTNPSLLRKQLPHGNDSVAASLLFYYECLKIYCEVVEAGHRIDFPIISLQITPKLDSDMMDAGKDMHELLREINELYHMHGAAPAFYQEGLIYKVHEIDSLPGGDAMRHIPANARFAIKIPLTTHALAACHALKFGPWCESSLENITQPVVNVTLCFSAEQALMAAHSGADYISIFVGRLDDVGQDGMKVVEDAVTALKPYKAKVLVASVRNKEHVLRAMLCGAHAATMPIDVLEGLYKHELTVAGLKRFSDDWCKTH